MVTELLFDNRLAPITSEIGFLELPMAPAVAAYLSWQRRIHEPLQRSITERRVDGRLDDVLGSLLPLVSILPSRSLFVPTASPWVAYFDNGWRGTDAFPPMSFLARELGCRGIRVAAVPDRMEGAPGDRQSRYGALILEVYGPDSKPVLNHVRTISLVNDDSWDFDQSGTPFPFEDVNRYQERRKWDRFTFAMLVNYLEHLGLQPFEESFYLPQGSPAALIEMHGSLPQGTREYSLAEAQG